MILIILEKGKIYKDFMEMEIFAKFSKANEIFGKLLKENEI